MEENTIIEVFVRFRFASVAITSPVIEYYPGMRVPRFDSPGGGSIFIVVQAPCKSCVVAVDLVFEKIPPKNVKGALQENGK
jgi:hypothetical protein